jgi:ADP-ribose pyrophosphatase YjhB (NUDIX family)
MSRRYPERPVAGVGAIILDGDRVLLVERGNEPLKGVWSIPGGALETGESLLDGVRREAREELGLEVEVGELVELFERITRDARGRVEYHFVLADYLCTVTGGTLRASDDAADARWVGRLELAALPLTEGTAKVIEKAFRLRAEAAARFVEAHD